MGAARIRFCIVTAARRLRGHGLTIRRSKNTLRRLRATAAGPLPGGWVERARDTLAELVSSTGESVLLHGDLHHDNILLRGAPDGAVEWAVIDPKGIVGDVHFDVIQYLLNHPARGVLEACWSLKNGGDWSEGIRIAHRFVACPV